jgi:alpha-ketoglutarate-dependent 2,4-dichlorophenoxyacetate dioxygenase
VSRFLICSSGGYSDRWGEPRFGHQPSDDLILGDDVHSRLLVSLARVDHVCVLAAHLCAGTLYVHITNVAADTTLVAETDRRALANRANQLWHTDSSFKATPALASVLSARTIPEDGGETEFVSTRLACDRLSEGQREELRDLVVVHSYATSRDQIDPALMTPVERAVLPPVRWRLIWRNPANARDALYIASHAGAIEGMDDARSRALLARLIDEATQSAHVYSHRWRAGDVILWDNRATMHRGRPWPGTQARLMVRTTISARDIDGLDQVRPN